MNYHFTKKHSKANARIVRECKICDKDFHGFYLLRVHKLKEHVRKRGSGSQDVDVIQLMGITDYNSLKVELKTGKHFLMDSEMKNGKHRVYNIAMDTVHPKNLLEKLDDVFYSLKYEAKRN